METARENLQDEGGSSSAGVLSTPTRNSTHPAETDNVASEEVEVAEHMSVDQVSQLMREQDADLLESMHYASSEVSQYSPGGTPILRPKDRALPMEDLPLLDESSVGTAASSSDVRSANFHESPARSMLSTNNTSGFAAAQPRKSPARSMLSTANSSGFAALPARGSSHSRSLHDRNTGVGLGTLDETFASFHGEEPSRESQENSIAKTDLPQAHARFRRLLSGEVRAMEEEQAVHAEDVGEEEETTASPISVAQEAASTALREEQKKQSGLAEQRRVREAMQFAEAVGEKISIRQDELRIIEDSTEDGESDDDDDDGCESKEIVVGDMESIHDAMSASQSHSISGIPDTPKPKDDKPSVLPSHVDVPPGASFARRKSKRPMWPFGPAGSDYDRFLDNLPDGSDRNDFVYKGICANPPEITKRGIQRGNYAQLHRKAWLEVSDKYHRYGKNLRIYYKYWERLGFPTNQFFSWLDSKGEAAGQPLPNLEECPRSVLDSDTVLYITNPEVTEGYALDIVCNEDGKGRIIDVDGSPVNTGPDGWIFILRDNVMYGAQKITSITGHSKQRFHHSSFFGGKAVAAAGIIITDEEGILTRLYPHSGHYRPGEAHMQRMLFFLHRKGVDLRTFYMDTQQFRHVSREKDAGKVHKDGEKKGKDGKESEKKMKKVDSLHMEKAVNVACFLAHKASFIGSGIFGKIHKIRKADATSVSEALDLVDGGGHWNRRPTGDISEALEDAE